MGHRIVVRVAAFVGMGGDDRDASLGKERRE